MDDYKHPLKNKTPFKHGKAKPKAGKAGGSAGSRSKPKGKIRRAVEGAGNAAADYLLGMFK